MFYSCLLYIGIFLWLLLSTLLDFVSVGELVDNFLFLISLGLLVCLAGFRVDTGTDFSSYATLFSTHYSGQMELGIVFLSQLAKALAQSQIAFFFSIVPIQGYFIWRAIHLSSQRKTPHTPLSFCAYKLKNSCL